jgi:hypothetical protein
LSKKRKYSSASETGEEDPVTRSPTSSRAGSLFGPIGLRPCSLVQWAYFPMIHLNTWSIILSLISKLIFFSIYDQCIMISNFAWFIKCSNWIVQRMQKESCNLATYNLILFFSFLFFFPHFPKKIIRLLLICLHAFVLRVLKFERVFLFQLSKKFI